MAKKEKVEEPKIEYERYSPTAQNGLTNEQVEERKQHNLTNVTSKIFGKTYFQIIRDNVFSFFNCLLYAIAILMIIGQQPISSYIFLIVLFANVIIGLYQDIKARILMDRMSVVTAPKAFVIRDGQQIEIPINEVVLDDVILLKTASQIVADCILLEGTLSVNESLLTGEPRNVNKKPGDILYSGSYVTSGEGYVKADKIGKDTYIETVQGQARKFKRSASQILNSLHRLFFVIGVIVIFVAIWTLILLGIGGSFSDIKAFSKNIGSVAGSLVGMIPAGLYLLTSLALAAGVVALANQKAQVQDFYSIEMLSRTDVLCVDKTGTITDGTMEVTQVDFFKGYAMGDIIEAIGNCLRVTKDDNFTAVALRNYFHECNDLEEAASIPFNSENKYSAVSFKDVGTYMFGAGEFLPLSPEDKKKVVEAALNYTTKGYRVLTVAKSKTLIKNDKVVGLFKPMGLIILEDHIKEDAKATFEWFNNNNVKIKVISGDNVLTVKEVAKKAGVLDSENYISLEGMSVEEVREIADKYTIFGRVSPEQKEAIVLALQDSKHTVAMTGDGVNDILALKRADCSIAMASGSEAARNVSHIVLLDSNFAHLPNVVGEGRRVVNNLQRTSSIFLVKTAFVVFFSILFLILISAGHETARYPFITNNLLLWEVITIGLSAFILALQKNNDKISGNFLANIFRKAVPPAIMMIFAVGTIFILGYLDTNGFIDIGIKEFGFATGTNPATGATAMAVLTFSTLSLVVLFGVCFPLDWVRGILFGANCVVVFFFLIFFGVKKPTDNIIKIDFSSLCPANYVVVTLVVVIVSGIYIWWLLSRRTIHKLRSQIKDEK